MSHRPSLLILLVWLSGLVALPASPTPSSIELGIDAFTLRPGEHERGFPLRLAVTFANRSAADARQANADNLRARQVLRESGRMESMTAEQVRAFHDRHPTVPVSATAFGDAKTPLASAIQFNVWGPKGEVLSGAVRPLAVSRDLRGPIELDGVTVAALEFGIDPAEMASWPEGTITVQTGMVNDPTTTASLRIEFRNAPPAPSGIDAQIRRAYLTGLYQRQDRQHPALRQTAEAILQLDADSPFGLELMGDALRAEGKTAEAQIAFARAARGSVELQKKQGNPSPEAPVYLLRQLESASERLKGVKGAASPPPQSKPGLRSVVITE